ERERGDERGAGQRERAVLAAAGERDAGRRARLAARDAALDRAGAQPDRVIDRVERERERERRELGGDAGEVRAGGLRDAEVFERAEPIEPALVVRGHREDGDRDRE